MSTEAKPRPRMTSDQAKQFAMKVNQTVLNAVMLQGAKDRPEPQRFGPPKLPPGVIPSNPPSDFVALDSAYNMSLYDYCNQGINACGIGIPFPGYQVLAQLAQRSEYRAPVETHAQEMTRMGFEIVSSAEGDSGDKIKELTQDCKDFNVLPLLRRIAEIDGFFGRAQLFVSIKGQESDKARKLPLLIDPKGIAVGSLLGFKAIEPTWTTPYTYNSLDPTAPDFYKPRAWYVLGKQTDSSRLLNFISREVPDLLKPSYNFGGLSMTQLMEPYVQRWFKTVDGVNQIINNFSIIALATNMAATLSGDAGDELMKRAQLFTQTRNNQGLWLLDKETEELVQIAVPLSGLHELQAQAQEHMAAPSHIPLVKLTGITPSGLNASSEGEIQVFYDYEHGMQELFYRPNLEVILRILQLNRYGTIDPDLTVNFVPLDQLSGTELAQVRKSDADMDVGYINSGVVSPDEVRERIQRDPTSGYNHLKGDAPPPPEQTSLETQHELGEESADNAHARSEESAEAAHKREKETKKKDD